ncbi:MAG: TIGR03067 domain-containing protein, partial [Gemmatimonadaceae bacterium]
PEQSEGSAAVAGTEQQVLRVAQDDKKKGAQDDTEIEGEFPMISAVFDGKPLADTMVAWCKRVTHGDVTQVLAGPQSMVDATFTLDATHSPKHIDYVNRSGTNTGKKQAGIYDISGDTLRICMAPPGDARPTAFESKKGDGRSLTVWRLT